MLLWLLTCCLRLTVLCRFDVDVVGFAVAAYWYPVGGGGGGGRLYSILSYSKESRSDEGERERACESVDTVEVDLRIAVRFSGLKPEAPVGRSTDELPVTVPNDGAHAIDVE